MMATPNSKCFWRRSKLSGRERNGLRSAARWLFTFAVLVVLLPAHLASAADTNRFARAAEKAHTEAKKIYRDNPDDREAAWKFGRACFDRAEFARNDKQREQIANEGIAVCRKLVARDLKSVEGHYYLAMNLGQLARTKTLGALKIVDEMEQLFLRARELNHKFDYAGADRNLGLLYFEAPAFGSIGSKSKARQHLQRAVTLAPEYPENHLNLLEAYQKWGDKNGVTRQLKALEKIWEDARKKFSGEKWDPSWLDWEARLKKIRQKADDPREVLESPRGRP